MATIRGVEDALSGRTAVVVDPYPLWLEAVTRVLTRLSVTLVGSAGTGAESLQALGETAPDLLIVELWPRGWPVEEVGWVAQARALVPGMKLIVLSSHGDDDHIDSAFAAGADAYVVKTALADDLETAIRQTFDRSVYIRRRDAHGETSAEPALAEREPELTRRAQDTFGLTRREVEILRLVAMGHSNPTLARMLWVTEQTVKFHLSNIYRKTGASNRTAASRWALAHGLLTRSDEAGDIAEVAS